MRVNTILISVIFFCACQSQENKTPVKDTTIQDFSERDSMPVLIPESPESANIFVPENNQDMPVITPDSIKSEN